MGSRIAHAPKPAPQSLRKTTEFALLAPRLVPLSDEQRLEAIGLLAELLVEAALKRIGSGVVFDGVMDGAFDSVATISERRAKPRRAA